MKDNGAIKTMNNRVCQIHQVKREMENNLMSCKLIFKKNNKTALDGGRKIQGPTQHYSVLCKMEFSSCWNKAIIYAQGRVLVASFLKTIFRFSKKTKIIEENHKYYPEEGIIILMLTWTPLSKPFQCYATFCFKLYNYIYSLLQKQTYSKIL